VTGFVDRAQFLVGHAARPVVALPVFDVNMELMKLGFEETQTPYASGSQSARAWTEQWVHNQVYCPNCGSAKIEAFPNNSPVADFYCLSCKEEYELKSQRTAFRGKVLDGAFRTKCERLAANNNPSLFLLNYDLKLLSVINFFVVPKHFFVRNIIEERKPLAPSARRAGWIGSKILLNQIPEAGKIFMVRGGLPEPRETVLSKWKQTLFLRDQAPEARGWLIDVMRCVETIGKRDFQLEDVYAFESRLSQLYPDNRHVRPKIRQQLQFLRDRGNLDFVSRGYYRLKSDS
jgi:type II restriction enzyme